MLWRRKDWLAEAGNFCCKNTLDRLVASGAVPSILVGRMRLIAISPQDYIAQMVQEQRERPVSGAPHFSAHKGDPTWRPNGREARQRRVAAAAEAEPEVTGED